MRSHEERVAETKRRIAKMEREKRLRRNTVTMASAVAACLALLVGASLAMPGIAASIQTGDYSGFETAASIFHGGAAPVRGKCGCGGWPQQNPPGVRQIQAHPRRQSAPACPQ